MSITTPWHVADEDCVYDAQNEELAHDVGRATAHLIAAAPDLCGALAEITRCVRASVLESARASINRDEAAFDVAFRSLLESISSANAALAKAHGETT